MFHPDSAPSRARFLLTVLVSLALCLTVLAGAPGSSAASPANSASPASAAAKDDPAGSPGVDFPILPRRCYDPEHPAPTLECPILSYGSKRPIVVLWGDSHAWQYLPAVKREAKARRLNLVLFMAGGCPPTLRPAGVRSKFPSCDTANRAAYDYVTQKAAAGREIRVLLGSFWAYYRIGYLAIKRGTSHEDAYHEHLFRVQRTGTKPLFKSLGRARIPFDVIGQSAAVPNSAPECARGAEPYQCTLPRGKALRLESNTRDWLASLTDPLPGGHRYINTVRAYCNGVRCLPRVQRKNVFYDRFHLGARFASTLGRYFAPSLDKLTR